jgi:hypothetical protein
MNADKEFLSERDHGYISLQHSTHHAEATREASAPTVLMFGVNTGPNPLELTRSASLRQPLLSSES